MRNDPVQSPCRVRRVGGILVVRIISIASILPVLPLLSIFTSSPARADEQATAPELIASRAPSHEQEKQIAGLRAEAAATLLRGDFDRARREFESILQLSPSDAAAQRDAGRAAQAAGEFEYAAEALERAHHFESHCHDPELHYLRGEALFVLGRLAEAEREHRIAELEIGDLPTDRMSKLWLARIYARRGFYVRADRIYDPMWPSSPSFDAEVGLNQADAHILNEDWEGAERVLGRYLARDPNNLRGRELLAWTLEVKGDLDTELNVRHYLASDAPTGANHYDYGRALERAADYAGARDEYDSALRTGARDPDGVLSTAAKRMRLRTTPELAGGVSGRSDSQANALRLQVGGVLPFGQRHSLSLLAWRDDSRGGFPSSSGSVTALGSTLQLAARNGASVVVGADIRYNSADLTNGSMVISSGRQTWRAGTQVEGESPLGPHMQLNVHGDYHEQWSESPITIQQGGITDGVTTHFFAYPRTRRLLLDAGGQFRRLTLGPGLDGVSPQATQELLFIGGDAVLWSNPLNLLHGEVVDERMIRRTYLSDAALLSYRHYELFTDSQPAFTTRIELAPRAAINNLSMVFRKVLAGGRIGFDLRGGGGYDNIRKRTLSQGGASVLIAATWSSRIMLSYDVSHETATGLSGTLHTGWVTYHADL
jgi:tetratricopeptide (TPR) repeat protein